VLQFEPGRRIGAVYFGSSRFEVEQALGTPNAHFTRTAKEGDPILVFDGHGLHITMDSGGHVQAVSVFPPNQVLVAGVPVLGRRTTEVVAALVDAGVSISRTDVGALCRGLGAHLVDCDGIVDALECTPA